MKRLRVQILKLSLAILVGMIVLFGLIYCCMEGWDLVHSLYSATMIQTLVGLTNVPSKQATKLVMSLQALTSFLLVSGVVTLLLTEEEEKEPRTAVVPLRAK